MPFDAFATSPSLAQTALHGLRVMFTNSGHSPSPDQWAAIGDLLEHLERAATGSLAPAVYLSAIPAGTGKSTAIAQFAMALMKDAGKSDVGMLITCNRVEEVAEMATHLQAWRHRLCIVVGQERTTELAMGDHQDARDAQVVICTQAALKQTLRAVASFDDASRFHYRGHRRQVIAWDEAFAFQRPVVLNPDDATRLTGAIKAQSQEAKAALLHWSLAIDNMAAGRCEVPDFEALRVDFRRLEEDVAEDDDAVAQAKALAVLSGGVAYLMRDNLTGACLISHVPEIPASLMPVIVTDASAARGVHHESYEMMARDRTVIWLREAPKTYGNLTLRIVDTAASRSTYRAKDAPRGRALIEMAVSYIRRVAPEPVLVIGYRNRFTMRGVVETSIKAAIEARLTVAERKRVAHLTWGRHTATNAFKDHRHVVLMGLNYLPAPAAHAAAGAALNLPMRTEAPGDHPTVDQVAVMRRGMLRDATLQALLRGNARKAVGSDCGEMTAVIPQAPKSDVGLSDDEYRGMFPGVSIIHDASLLPIKALKGNLKKLSEIVTAHVEAGAVEMAYPDLAREMGKDLSNFRDTVKKPEWRDWVASVGLSVCRLKGRSMGLRRVHASSPGIAANDDNGEAGQAA